MKSGFAAAIIEWQAQHGRHELPWQREPVDPYCVWLSEMMLQQTQVVIVIPYFERFIACFPTIQKLATAQPDQVMALWSGLGYYRRAQYLHAAAKLIIDDYGGTMPDHVDELMRLPGIGRSTAGAIVSLAWNRPAPMLDSNAKRVLCRHQAVAEDSGKILWQTAQDHIPCHDARAYTQGLMDLGSMICGARAPLCPNCPVGATCKAWNSNSIGDYPKRKSLRARKLVEVFWGVAVNSAHSCIWLQKRPLHGIWAGLWSFPDFSNEKESKRWLYEISSPHRPVVQSYPAKDHKLTHRHLRIYPAVAKVNSSTGVGAFADEGWIHVADLANLALPAPVRVLCDELLGSVNTGCCG